MRIRLALLLSVMFITSGLARTADLALTSAKIYTSPTDPPIENGSIVIREGLILSVGPSSTVKIPHSATVIDCKGLVVTAGFWNSHVHILAPALLHVQDSDAGKLDQELDTIFNRWGFTTVFDIASVLDNTLALRRRIELQDSGTVTFTSSLPLFFTYETRTQGSLTKSWTQSSTVGVLPPFSTSLQCLTTLLHCAAASKAVNCAAHVFSRSESPSG